MEEVFEKFYEIKQKIKDLQEKEEKYKKYIEEYLRTENVKKSVRGGYEVKMKETKTERMNKSDCPSDIWRTFSKKSVYNSISISKIKN